MLALNWKRDYNKWASQAASFPTISAEFECFEKKLHGPFFPHKHKQSLDDGWTHL